MAITVVGTPTTAGNASEVSSQVVNVPTGAASGDIAVIYLGQWNAGTPTITPASGFAQKGATWTSGDSVAKNSIWWKRLTGADTGTYSFSWSIGMWTTMQCVMFRGCISSGDPWQAVATPVTGTFGTYTTMSVTLGSAGDALYWAAYNDTAGTHTPPDNFTEAADNDSGACAYWMPGSAGSKSAANGSVTSSSAAGAWLGALSEDPGGAAVLHAAVQAAQAWPVF